MVNEKEYDWSALAAIAPPKKWLDMYSHYQEILINEDVAGFWNEQFRIANAEREELKQKVYELQLELSVTRNY